MIPTLILFAEAAIILTVLYLFYRHLYHKIAYFNLSRYYLLFAPVPAFGIPMISDFLPQQAYRSVHGFYTKLMYYPGSNTAFVEHEALSEPVSSGILNPVNVLLLIYWSGVSIKFFILLKQMVSLRKLIKSSEKERYGKYLLCRGKHPELAFSFFNYIFLSNKFYVLPKKEQSLILMHEKIHADEKHSADILLYELVAVLLWFNPLMMRIKSAVKEVHEFVADNMLTANKNRPDYSTLLVKAAIKDKHSKMGSNFTESLKSRIKLISYPLSVRYRKRIFQASLPVLILVSGTLAWSASVINAAAGIRIISQADLQAPLKNADYKIASPFFLKKEIKRKEKPPVVISHPGISYAVRSNADVLSVCKGTVTNITKEDDFGLAEYKIKIRCGKKRTVVYSGISKVLAEEGEFLQRGDIIGNTGDNRLYPVIKLELFENGQAVNPVFCY